MQYFKHMSNMRHDIKIKRVISKYGLEGYGLYNLILESITENLTTDSPNPDLQESCADIAEFYNGDTTKINEIAAFMMNQGLFELDEVTSRILCTKLYKFLEASQTRSEKIREMIKKYKTYLKTCGTLEIEQSKMSVTVYDKSERIEEEEEEEKKKEYNKKKPIIKKNQYAEFVKMTEVEYTKLIEKHGKAATLKMIEILDNAKGAKGYKYKSDYRAILSWVEKEYLKQQNENKPKIPAWQQRKNEVADEEHRRILRQQEYNDKYYHSNKDPDVEELF